VFDEIAAFKVVAKVACQCGSASLHILGYPHPEMAGYLLSPLSAECAACGRITPLFDIREHGYDAEFGYCGVMPGSGEPQRHVCPQCSGVKFAACPAFSYQFEVSDFEVEQAAHVQDFFDCFSLNVLCEHCGALSTAADYECA
jgi:hypothetical protein